MKSALRSTLLCSALIVLAGCANSRVDPSEYSGFLKDYSRLQEAASISGAPVMRWVDPKIKAGQFTQVYVEPSQFYPKPQPTEVITPQTLQQITHYYDAALKRELGAVVPLAAGPGPKVLVVRPAITAVATHSEGLKPYEVIPIALVAAAVNTAAGGRDQAVNIATEAAFLDGGNNAVVAQVVRKGAGKELENKSTKLTVQDVKPVLDGWASDMRRSFAALRSASR